MPYKNKEDRTEAVRRHRERKREEEREMEEIVSRFRSLGLDRLLLTKLDEAATFGTIVNMSFLTKLPISYFTIGQKVPEDIREATSKIISDLIFSMTPLKKTEGAAAARTGCESAQNR